MTDLLFRLSVATASSRKLDAEIALANGWIAPSVQDKMSFYSDASNCWRGPVGQIEVEPPRYTESIDAALTLVPEGCTWEITTGFEARVWPNKTAWPCCGGSESTPAIALVIACLKAKEESK